MGHITRPARALLLALAVLAPATAHAQTANLAISITDGSELYTPGGVVVYTITAVNLGPAVVNGATVLDFVPSGMSDCSWTAPTGATGTGDMEVVLTMQVSASYVFTYQCTAPAIGYIENTAYVVAPPGITDPNGVNNRAADGDGPATVVVTNLNDDGVGSLRRSLLEVGVGGTILFAPALTGGTITLTSGPLSSERNLTIVGAGLTVSGNGSLRPFWIPDFSITTITGLVITNGRADSGAAIINLGTLTLMGVTIVGNASDADGGAIYNVGVLTIADSTIAGNSAAYSGGAVYNYSALTITNSTISGNTAGWYGAGIFNRASVTASNVTVSGNASTGTGTIGGGGLVSIAGTMALNHLTITGNSAPRGGGIGNFASLVLRNSLVAGNTSTGIPGDVDGNALQAGSSNNQIGGSAALGPLQDNGGTTLTHAPRPGSVAIDGGIDVAGLTTDQRGAGFARKVGTAADIGALETSYAMAATAGTPQQANLGTPFATALRVSLTESGRPVAGVNVTFAAPASGASGAFASGATIATNASGIATAPTLTANGVAGSYEVAASVGAPVPPVTFALTNDDVNDAPSFVKGANQAVAEDSGARTVVAWASSISAGQPGDIGQTVAFEVVSNSAPALFATGPAISPTGTLTYTPADHAFGIATVTVVLHDSGGTASGGVDTSAPQPFTITVTSVADTPSITSASTTTNVQTSAGLVVTRHPADGVEVTHFKVTGITGGTLFLADGVTAVTDATLITVAQGLAGLRFTPAHDSTATGHVTVRASTSAGDEGLGGSAITADVTVQPLAKTYYLAEGATGSFFDLDIVVANPNDTDALVAMTFLDAHGQTHALDFTLGAKRSRTIAVETEVPALANAEVSTVVASPTGLPLIVERSLFWDATYYGGHTGSAVDGPQTTWYFGEGFQSAPVFDTFILLANANATPAHVTLTFLRQGSTPVTTTKTIAATSRANFWAAELPAELEGQSFSTVVTSDIPIIAERAMYFGTPTFNGGHESAGVSTPATSWFHAEGRTGPLFDTYVLIGNPGQTPAHVTVRFLRANDTPLTTSLVVAAQGRETLYVDGFAGLPDTDVSTEVTSDVPVISERSMYWPGEFAQWYEAHNSFGVTSTGLAWGLAEGRFGFPQQFETYILLANPTATPTRVRVTFLRQGKAPIVSEQLLEGNARRNADMSALLGAADFDPAGERFGAIVESLDNVGIVVERAMYFSTGGAFWNGGTNATGVRLR